MMLKGPVAAAGLLPVDGEGGGSRQGLSIISSSNFFRLIARELRRLFPGGSGSAWGGLWVTRGALWDEALEALDWEEEVEAAAGAGAGEAADLGGDGEETSWNSMGTKPDPEEPGVDGKRKGRPES